MSKIQAKHITVEPGTLITIRGVGIQINCGVNDPEFGEQPYVTVNTETLDERFTYGESNGMPIIAIHLNDATLYDDEGTGPQA